MIRACRNVFRKRIESMSSLEVLIECVFRYDVIASDSAISRGIGVMVVTVWHYRRGCALRSCPTRWCSPGSVC